MDTSATTRITPWFRLQQSLATGPQADHPFLFRFQEDPPQHTDVTLDLNTGFLQPQQATENTRE